MVHEEGIASKKGGKDMSFLTKKEQQRRRILGLKGANIGWLNSFTHTLE